MEKYSNFRPLLILLYSLTLETLAGLFKDHTRVQLLNRKNNTNNFSILEKLINYITENEHPKLDEFLLDPDNKDLLDLIIARKNQEVSPELQEHLTPEEVQKILDQYIQKLIMQPYLIQENRNLDLSQPANLLRYCNECQNFVTVNVPFTNITSADTSNLGTPRALLEDCVKSTKPSIFKNIDTFPGQQNAVPVSSLTIDTSQALLGSETDPLLNQDIISETALSGQNQKSVSYDSYGSTETGPNLNVGPSTPTNKEISFFKKWWFFNRK